MSEADPAWDERLERLRASSARVADVLTELDVDGWRAPSLLPGWSRAHVAAHIALNAEGLVRAVGSRADAEPLPVYDSDQARSDDVETLAAADVDEVVTRLVRADAALLELLASLSEDERATGSVARTPGGPSFAFADMATTRRRELEVHLIDLGARAVRAAWPEDFVVELLERTTWDRYDDGPFTVRATDLDREWTVGEGMGPVVGPVVVGLGAELGWWLSGRQGADLDGDLPPLSPWVRRPGP